MFFKDLLRIWSFKLQFFTLARSYRKLEQFQDESRVIQDSVFEWDISLRLLIRLADCLSNSCQDSVGYYEIFFTFHQKLK